MAHKDFDAALRAVDAYTIEPVTFRFGGEDFTVNPVPTIGDARDLLLAPAPTPENEEAARLALMTFIRRMLVDDETRDRWDKMLYRVPMTKADALVGIADYIVEAATGFPTRRRRSSSGGRRRTGPTFKPSTDGNTN
jgi:hypothetical protein